MDFAIKYLLIISAFFITEIYGSIGITIIESPATTTTKKPESSIPTWGIVLIVLLVLSTIILFFIVFITWKKKKLCFAQKNQNASKDPEICVKTNPKAQYLPYKHDVFSQSADDEFLENLTPSKQPSHHQPKQSKNGEEKNSPKLQPPGITLVKPVETIPCSDKECNFSSEKPIEKTEDQQQQELYLDAFGNKASPYETVQINGNEKSEKKNTEQKLHVDAYGRKASPYETLPSEEIIAMNENGKITKEKKAEYTDDYGNPKRSPYLK